MNTLKREKQLSNSDLHDTVKVFCRLRPLQDECELPSIKLVSPTTLTLSSECKTKQTRKGCNYVFRHVFTSYSGQREVFEHVALPLLEDLITGKNGLLFTYGVTGSGKTYTLTGDQTSPGIMPSCINTLFNSIGDRQAQKYLIKSDRMNGFEMQSENEALEERFQETKSGKRLRTIKKTVADKIMYSNDGTRLKNINDECIYSIFVSYTEIYNNAVYDLLDESNSKILQAKIIREDWQKNMYVNGVEEVEVKSAAEAFELFYMGQKRKRMAHTLLNAESSRSHSIFNIRVVQLIQNVQGDIPSETMIKVGQLSLVDLAGSERCNRTNNTGIRLKEASSINNSLMTLRTCLEVLRENQTTGSTKVIPYRDSRLTLLFKNYFEGEGQVRMIVCINPSEQDCEENLQVLKFAEITQEVQVTKPESRYQQFRTPNAKSTPRETPKTTKSKGVPAFSFGPKIPIIKLDFENLEETSAGIEKVLKCLQVRKIRGVQNRREFSSKEKHFRKRLLNINQESVLTQAEVRNLKAILKKEKLLSQNLNVKITDLETANHCMQSKNNELENVVRTLQLTIDEKNLKLNQNCLEQQKNKQKLAIQSEKLNKELEDKLRQQRYHMEVEMQAKDLKLKKMKEIIESEEVAHEQQFASEMFSKVVEANENNPLHNFSSTATTRSTLTNKNTLNRGRAKAGDVWLEHNSIKPIPLNTVMQPSMKKRKSVDKLKKAADVTNAKQTKYCLIAQESDGAGDVETKLYKGDIIPTCGGGAQVVFNGVECLREESPTRMPLTPRDK